MELPLEFGPTPKELSGYYILTYKGAATDQGSIEATNYATSILGFSTAINRISTKTLGKTTVIKIEEEKNNCWKTICEFFLSADVQTVKNIAEWLIILSIPAHHYNKLPIAMLNYIIDILKKANGKIQKIKSEIGKLEIPYILKEQLSKLIKDSELREAIDDMTKILELEGIDKISFEQKDYIRHKILKNERPSLIAQPEDETEEEYQEKIVSIVYISPDRTSWKFKDKNKEFWAQVTDKQFLNLLKDKRIEDISDDFYTATLHTISTKEAGTKRTKIERYIYDFKPKNGNSQLSLF